MDCCTAVFSSSKISLCRAVLLSCCTALLLLLFALADDVVLFKGDEYLWTANPHLELFFKSYLQQPKVAEWCRSMRPDLVEGSAS